jgi:hypothetical protein
MKTQLSMFVSVLMAFGTLTQAQDSTAPAPAQTEMQKWIATTDAQWQAVFKRDVTDVHEAELNKLKLQYLTSLETGIAKASGANDLDGAVALRNEQKRFGDTNVFPEKDEDSDAASVKQLRAAIRAQLAKLEKGRAARIKAVLAKYDQVLANAQTQLTQHQRLDDALLVKKQRAEVAAAWLSGNPVAPVQEPAEQPKPQPVAPPPAAPAAAAPEAVSSNLFKNPNFENGTNEWKLTTWGKTGKITIDPTESHNGKPSLRVENPDPQHTLVNQKVTVKPNTRYLLAGYIKTKDVEPPKRGQHEGAELMVTGGSRRSAPMSRTNPWTKVTYILTTLPSETEMVVGISLGHYGAAAKGTAWFSEMSLTELGRNAKK